MRNKTFKSAPNLANVEDGAHLDVVACGFYENCHQKIFLDVKVFRGYTNWRGRS